MIRKNVVRASLFRFLLFCLSGFYGIILFNTPAIAQEVVDQNIKEENGSASWRLGFSFSGLGVLRNLNEQFLNDIESVEDDLMPYPGLFFTMSRNKFEIALGWSRDGDSHAHSSHYVGGQETPRHIGGKHNEHIFIFSARYNYYPWEKRIYIYGGPVLWYFNKELTFQLNDCGQDLIPGECVPGTEFINYLETDRPDGISTRLGIQIGLGLEYNFIGLIFFHEIEFFRSTCSYDNFICSGTDLKFLGIHFTF